MQNNKNDLLTYFNKKNTTKSKQFHSRNLIDCAYGSAYGDLISQKESGGFSLAGPPMSCRNISKATPTILETKSKVSGFSRIQ
jgi:hypothetical protein